MIWMDYGKIHLFLVCELEPYDFYVCVDECNGMVAGVGPLFGFKRSDIVAVFMFVGSWEFFLYFRMLQKCL